MDLAGRLQSHVRPVRSRGSRGATIALVLGLGLAVTGPAWAVVTFEAHGRVTAVDPARAAVTLEHAGIPGLLPAARSEFPVASGAVLKGVQAGDRVRFTLAAADESHGLLTVATLAPDAVPGGNLDRLVAIVAIVLALLAIAAAVGGVVVLWRTLAVLHRRVIALDHEAGMLRGLVTDTQDGVRQIARALEETATTLRVGYVRELRRRLGAASASRGSETGAAGEPGGAMIVVQRGRGELYHAVESGAAGPDCTVIWDRRRGERRGGRHPVSHERRRAERRAVPPETWTRLGFHLVPPGGPAEAPRGIRPLRSASGERGAAR
jgi:Cu/Ag efflux protein CusF